MKTLVFCPVHPVNGLYTRTKTAIENQDYGGTFDVRYSMNNPHKSKGRNVAHNYELARQFVLEHDYDAMLTVESDIIAPIDALTKLAQVEGDIIYALYAFRRTGRWNVFVRLDILSGDSISKNMAVARGAWGKVIDATGIGTGCTLIRREVLEAISFHSDADPPLGHDWHMATKAQALGFTQKAHMGVICGHIQDLKNKYVIWPNYYDGFHKEHQERFSTSEPGIMLDEEVGDGLSDGE